jgi:hypothetical protein
LFQRRSAATLRPWALCCFTRRPFTSEAEGEACVAHMLLKTTAQYQIYLECFNSYLVFSHNTALHAASAKGHIEVCKLLVSSLANVHATNRGCDAHPRDMILKTNADFLFFF